MRHNIIDFEECSQKHKVQLRIQYSDHNRFELDIIRGALFYVKAICPNGLSYTVHFFTIEYIQKQINSKTENEQIPYFSLPGMIIVKNFTPEILSSTIERLYNSNFFKNLQVSPFLESNYIWKGHQSQIIDCHFSNNGDILITLDSKGIFHIWSYPSWQLLTEIDFFPLKFNLFQITSDQTKIIASSTENIIYLIQISDHKILYKFIGHTEQISQIILTSNEEYMISSSFDHSILFWDMKTFQLKKKIEAHSKCITSCAATKNNILITTSEDRTIKYWNILTFDLIEVQSIPTYESNIIITKNDRFFITQSESIHTVWDLNSKKEIQTFIQDGNIIKSDCSSDGEWFGSISDAYIFKLWRLEEIHQKESFIQRPEAILFLKEGFSCLSFHPKNLSFIVCDLIGNIMNLEIKGIK